jgi:hypothetical protein
MNKNILNKLSQFEKNIELSEVKVDLALIDDVKKITKELNDLYNSAIKSENELDKITKQLYPALNSADTIEKKIVELQSKGKDVQSKYVKALQELGISPSDSKDNFALFDIMDSIETRRENIAFILKQFA